MYRSVHMHWVVHVHYITFIHCTAVFHEEPKSVYSPLKRTSSYTCHVRQQTDTDPKVTNPHLKTILLSKKGALLDIQEHRLSRLV